MPIGTLTKSTGSWFTVRIDETGERWNCRLKGKTRLDDLPLTNPIAVGDKLDVTKEEVEGELQGIINKILPRRNYVIRQSPRKKKQLHMLAANVDQAMLIVTVVEPMLKPGFIDRFLLTTTPHRVPSIVVFNKADLYDEKAMATYEEFKAVYEQIGLRVLLTSTTENIGIEAFKAILTDKTTLVGGQSGVGKSSLITSIQPDLDLRTGEISDRSGKGTHTTTFAEMFELDFGGFIIDTPGLKTLSFNNLEPEMVAHNFEEFFEKSSECKYGAKCMHRTEPHCAVKAAIETGELSERRYISYLTILDEVEEQNYWERRNKF